MPWEIGSGNNFAARREWLQRIGGNDERLGPGAPGCGAVDIDLFYRLARAGACVRYEPDVLVYHQRTDRAGRLARRVPYGFGMGAFCALHYFQGDRRSLRILFRWLVFRAGSLLHALKHRRGMAAYEEALVLWGTLGGVLFGLRGRSPQERKHS
jgi:hypothetical protein